MTSSSGDRLELSPYIFSAMSFASLFCRWRVEKIFEGCLLEFVCFVGRDVRFLVDVVQDLVYE